MDSKLNKNHIVFLEDSSSWGGVEKWILTVAEEFNAHNLTVTIAAPANSELALRGKSLGLDIFPLNVCFAGKMLHPVHLWKFAVYLKTHNIQTLFVNGSNELKFGGLAAYFAKTKRVIYRRGAALPIKNKFYNRFLFSRVLTILITNSESSRRCILKKLQGVLKPEKVKVIYNGVDLDKFSPKGSVASIREEFNIPKGHILICCIGRLAKQKGYEYAIEAIRMVYKNIKEFSVLIVGEGELHRKLQKLIEEKGLNKTMFLLGFRKDIPEILRATDFLLHTPLWEGAPNVILEAMACAKPVVSWDVDGIGELMEDNRTGYLSQEKDIEALTNNIKKMLEDIHFSKAKDMGRNARERAEKMFPTEKMIKEYLQVINESERR